MLNVGYTSVKRTLLIIIFLCFNLVLLYSAKPLNDSIVRKQILEIEHNSAMSKTEEYEKVIRFFFATSPKEAVEICNRWIKKADKLKDRNSMADAYTNLGKANIILGNYKEAEVAGEKAIKIYSKTGNLNGIGSQYGNLGVIAEMTGDYALAVSRYLKADSLFSLTGNTKSLAFVENNIGIVYNNMKLFDKSLAYYTKALQHKTGLKDSLGIASTHVNIGVLYESLKTDYDKALDHYEEARRIYDIYGLSPQRAATYNNIGLIKLNQGNLQEASGFFNEALEMRQQLQDKYGVASTKLNLALLAQKEMKFKDVIKYASESASIFKAADVKPKLAECHKLLAEAYEHNGESTKSLAELKNYIDLRDSVLNETNQKMVQELEAKYQNDVNQKKITILQQKNKINHLILIALLLAIVMIVLSIYFVLRHIRLKHTHEQLVVENRLFRTQMNPHFIFNTIGSVQSYMYDNDAKKASAYLSSFASLMRSILQQSSKDMITLSEEIVTLENYLQLENMRKGGVLRFSINVDENIDTGEILVPPMLVQPFAENAIKHAFKSESQDNEINITFVLNDDLLNVKIEDNGVGIDSKITGDNPEGHISMASKIFEQRMKLLGRKWNKSVDFKIEDLSAYGRTGTSVSFNIHV